MGMAIQLTLMSMTLATGIASSLINDLLQAVDQQLALLQVARLAPTTTASQAHGAITTMVYISFAEKFAHAGRLNEEKDPMPARIDNFGSGKVQKEQGDPIENQGSRAIGKMKSLASERSKNSFRSGKFTLQPSSKQPSPAREPSVKAKQSASSFMISLYAQSEVDNHQQNMRQAESDRISREQATQRQNQTEQREREKSAAIGLKLLKQKKPFTFDYQGASQGITLMHLPTEAVRKLKQELRSGEILNKKDRMCETMQVANPRQRIQGKSIKGQGPIFSQKGFSVVQALGDDSHLAEGVKITQVRGSSNNITLQHRTRRPQGKPYRLKDYKDLTKEKSFQEFPHASSSRKNSLLDLSASNADNYQDQKLKTLRKSRENKPKSRGNSLQALQSLKSKALDDALGRGLPFIRTKGLKFYDIGSASSMKTVDFSFNSSERRSHWRSSKIKISDTSLYEDVLLN